MNNQYTEKCCRLAWEQICLPMIHQQQDWSAEEDRLLENLVQIHGAYADQWQIIASNFVSTREDFSFSDDLFSSLIVQRICVQVVL